MTNAIKINERLTVGCNQPRRDDLQSLREEGFKSVVNLRVNNEDDGQPPPEEEGKTARSLGLTYLHLPVSPKQLRSEQVDEFRNAVTQLPQPIFVHCKSGKRSGAFAMMQYAIEQGWSGEETLQRANELGFELDTPELTEFMRSYLDGQS